MKQSNYILLSVAILYCWAITIIQGQWSQKNYDQFQSMHVPILANHQNWFNQFQTPNFLYTQTVLDSLIVNANTNQAIVALQYQTELALLKINLMNGYYQYTNVSKGEIHENLRYVASVIDNDNFYYILLNNEKSNLAYLFKISIVGGIKTQLTMLPFGGASAMVYSKEYQSIMISMKDGVVSLNVNTLSQNWKLSLKQQSKIHLLTNEKSTQFIYVSFMDSVINRVNVDDGRVSGQIKLHNGTIASMSSFKNDPNGFLTATITNTDEMTDYIAFFNIDKQISVQQKLVSQNIRGTYFQAYCNSPIGYFNSTKMGSEYNLVVACGLLQRSPVFTSNFLNSLKFTVNQFSAIETHDLWEKSVDLENLDFVAYNDQLNQIVSTMKSYLIIDTVTGKVVKNLTSQILDNSNGANGFKYLTAENGKIYAIGVDPSQVISFESL